MYSLDFAANVSRICMDEIRKRGLNEKKILRKSVPNCVLLYKVFHKRNCTPDDLTHVSIHSVATLMQDTLWCCQERIISKKVWRTINYETCTFDDLSRYISKKGERLLVEILDFLVQVMRHKESNQMNAYHLGEAMGKVTLGPGDCDPIMAEKAGHFLTRMVIEHSKTIHNEKQLLFRIDSGCVWPVVSKVNPMSKSEAAHAKAKSYNRIINKIHYRNQDWVDIASVAVYALMEGDYQEEPAHYDEPYLSIFTEKLNPEDATLSPILYRLVSEASKPIVPVPKDPFENSFLFGKRPNTRVETQVSEAFDDFVPLLKYSTLFFEVMRQEHEGKSPSKSHLKLINSPFSNMKLNLKKTKSHGEGDHIDAQSDENEVGTFVNPDYDNGKHSQKSKPVKGMMKRVIKMGSIAPAKRFPTTTIH